MRKKVERVLARDTFALRRYSVFEIDAYELRGACKRFAEALRPVSRDEQEATCVHPLHTAVSRRLKLPPKIASM
jgi:hypothetical protein